MPQLALSSPPLPIKTWLRPCISVKLIIKNCIKIYNAALSSKSRLKLKRRISKQTLTKPDKLSPEIRGVSYNPVYDELFFADSNNHVVRSMRLRDNAIDLRDVYRGVRPACRERDDTPPIFYCVCHMRHSDTLLVCSYEMGQETFGDWLVAFSRCGNEWREAHRVPIANSGRMCGALSNSRLLVGEYESSYVELFHVQSGPLIEHISRIRVNEQYWWFSATGGSDALVAMSYKTEESVCVHRLLGDRLELIAPILLRKPYHLLWLDDRILVAQEADSKSIFELELTGTILERRRELVTCSVWRWCKMYNKRLAIVEFPSRDIKHYSFS